MNLPDTHTHTYFSTDSEMNPEDAIIKAKALGLSGIVFTDHYDYKFNKENSVYIFDVDNYFKTLNNLKEKYTDNNFKVLIGIEVGMQPDNEIFEFTDKLVNSYPFDQVIYSTHLICGEDPYYPEFFEGLSKKQAYGKYIDEVLKNIKIWKGYDIFAHIDYLTRYSPYIDKKLDYSDFSEQIDEILQFIIDNSSAFEINTRTYCEVPFCREIFERYKLMGGKLISIGSDAHTLSRIGKEFDKNMEFAKSLGYDYAVHYENRKPVFDRL